MESLEYIFTTYDASDISELAEETPVGWSSTCLDQTISYYIDCNSMIAKNNEEKE
uniref:Uncharacterized protein n=1 Tax=Schizymenia dubyi TaxID=38368 RepID=A0A1C9C997_9FLOR|nr:hypothetical protein Schiz_061 [Schizymenia dubyi]AOM64944.1 hypothetical protein Schiz_061 [Schizymenia dubyi]